MKHWKVQLHDLHSGETISATGGVAYVAKAGLLAQESLLDSTGAAASNPSALTNGKIEFWTAETVVSVDLYVMAPGGQFVVKRTVKPSGPNEIFIDLSDRRQVAVIPFDHADQTAATEEDTGFDLPKNAAVQPEGIGVHVVDVDATETIDVGLLTGETGGDPNGFMAAVSVATAGFIAADFAVTAGSTETYFSANTLGVMLSDYIVGTDLDQDYGLGHKKPHVGDGTAKSITYTLTTGSDTASGYLVIPYVLPATV